MRGDERRQALLTLIKSSPAPLSGTELSKKLEVSRQVIVQDIALLRASNFDILSTNRGYVLNSNAPCSRIFKVKHTDSEMEDELNTIIDAGGKAIDVFVDHPIYGRLTAQLLIYSRKDVSKFMNKMKNGVASPLKNMTDNLHSHTVEAYSESILDDVEHALKEKGYLM